jgi:hypothetical protein
MRYLYIFARLRGEKGRQNKREIYAFGRSMRSIGAHNLALPLFVTSILALFVSLLVALGSAPAGAQAQYLDQYQNQYQNQYQAPPQYQTQYQAPAQTQYQAPAPTNGCTYSLLHPRGYSIHCNQQSTWTQ